ncbi:hypothetical protein HYS91_04315 [Candidatus Daviesbacteria bacterium]|nr:hypothetical protein [Candidatus Daviesbacteria bacterium]
MVENVLEGRHIGRRDFLGSIVRDLGLIAVRGVAQEVPPTPTPTTSPNDNATRNSEDLREWLEARKFPLAIMVGLLISCGVFALRDHIENP